MDQATDRRVVINHQVVLLSLSQASSNCDPPVFVNTGPFVVCVLSVAAFVAELSI